MEYFLHILLQNIFPMFALMGVGVVLQRCFRLDIRTLSKLNFYLFSPATVFAMLYESDLSSAAIGQVLLFLALFLLLLAAAAEAVIRLRGLKGGMKSAMRNSVLFYNSANYGIPLNLLVFQGNPFTLSIQVIVMAVQSLIPNTYGIYSVNAHKQRWQETVRTILSMPVIYAIPLAFLLRGFSVPIPEPLYTPLGYVVQAFIATALLTLGVQLGSMKWRIRLGDVAWSNALRLLGGPLLGYVTAWLLGLEGELAQALVLSCAVPSSLSSVLLSVEFDNEPEFASQAVFSSTLFSMVTVTFVIFWIHSPWF